MYILIMAITIPEIEARDLLLVYDGANNVLLEWKQKFIEFPGFSLTRSQAEYVIKHHKTTPKVAKKYIKLVSSFAEKMMTEKCLSVPLEKIWCEKLLCESDAAYHIWGKFLDTEQNHALWLPKFAVIQEEKKLNRIINYSKYDNRPLMEHQKVAVEKLLANNKFILADDMGVGKAESVENKIFTPYGRKRIGDICVGDKVIGSNGKECNVLGVFPQGKKDLYRVTFNDGYSVLVCKDHLWSVKARSFGNNTKNNRNKKSIVLSVDQMLDKTLELSLNGTKNNTEREYIFKTYFREKKNNLKWQIPIVSPIEFKNEKKIPLNPYLLGLILGDGGITERGISFTSKDKEIIENIKNILPDNSQINEIKNSKYGFRITRINGKHNPVIDILTDLKLMGCGSHNKFIPEMYKYGSIEDRLSILQGLMDTDGTCSLSNGICKGTEYSTISEQLADDVIEIVHSLGGIARKSSRKTFYTYNGIKKEGKKSYRINIKLQGNMNPFKLKRKSDLYNTPEKYKVGRYIKNIEFEKQGDAICISVDSPDKLYVTEHCIVTHNTTSAVIAAMESGVKKVLIVCPASLKINWEREIKNYSDEKILIVEGRKWGSTFKFYIINYDIIKNYHTTEKTEESDAYKLIVNENFNLAIVDEAHYISNVSANRTKLMNDILRQIPRVWLLTGTPMTSRPINYYNLLKIVDSPLAINWQQYVRRYCHGFQFRVGDKKIWNTSGASNLDELRERTKNIVLRRMKTDILDLPEKIINPIFLELKSTFYDEELEDFMRITKENKHSESISVTINRLMRIRQLISYEKIPYTCELIDKFVDAGKKVIVFTNFTMTLDMLHEKYKKISVVLDGRMPKNKRQESVDKFQNNDKIKIFIGNIKAAGVGITLTAAETVIMNDLSFVPSDHSQGEDRAYRYGQKNSVLVYYPVFENTIEQIIYNILQRKKDIIDQVMGDGEYSESFTKELFQSIL